MNTELQSAPSQPTFEDLCDMEIVFFDGVCGLCNRFVDWCLKQDTTGRIKYAPLQGTTAKRLLDPKYFERLDSVVFYQRGKISTHSTAVLNLMHELGYSRLITVPGLMLPGFLRNSAYELVSRSRYLIFGKREACRMPKPGERDRFLE